MDDVESLYPFLSPLENHGSWNWPSKEETVGSVKANWEGPDIVVGVQHGQLGKYSFTLHNVVVNSVSLPYDDDPDMREDVVQVLEYGVWEFSKDLTVLQVSHQYVLGTMWADLTVDSITLTTSESSADTGSCKVCGGTDFVLSGFGSMPIRATSPSEFVSTGPARLKLQENPSCSIRCKACNTKHPYSAWSSDAVFTVDGEPSRTPHVSEDLD